MSVLVVGLSHKSAPVAILEQAAVSGDTLTKLLHDIALADSVAETFVVSTCNRVEVYADVDRFHAGVTDICELLARHCGVSGRDLTPYLYVHYDERAVSHLLAVACGLDSVVAGEGQILGQVRSALKLAEEHGTVGRVLGELGRLALRAGKRARAETGIDRAGQSLVSLAIELGAAALAGPPGRAPGTPAVMSWLGATCSWSAPARWPRSRPRRPAAAAPRASPSRTGPGATRSAWPTGSAAGRSPWRTWPTPWPPRISSSHVLARWAMSSRVSWPRPRWPAGPRAAAPRARWCSSTWPCRAMWSRPSRPCPGPC